MAADTPFTALILRLRQGHEDAAATVFRRFTPRLIGLARRRLNRIVRPKVDPEDVVQAVFQNFFRCCRAGQCKLEGWSDLWALLTVITARKCAKTNAHFHRPCRDLRKESPVWSEDDAFSFSLTLIDPGTSADDATMLRETTEQFLGGLPALDRAMVVLRLHGNSVREISKTLDCTLRKIQRVLKRSRDLLERLRP
jgi:RNA polymerase sigma-70 factor (ECF subfamily)